MVAVGACKRLDEHRGCGCRDREPCAGVVRARHRNELRQEGRITRLRRHGRVEPRQGEARRVQAVAPLLGTPRRLASPGRSPPCPPERELPTVQRREGHRCGRWQPTGSTRTTACPHATDHGVIRRRPTARLGDIPACRQPERDPVECHGSAVGDGLCGSTNRCCGSTRSATGRGIAASREPEQDRSHRQEGHTSLPSARHNESDSQNRQSVPRGRSHSASY
jgi:hypothetical protein